MSDVVESTTPPVIAELPPLKERRNSLAAGIVPESSPPRFCGPADLPRPTALSHRPDQTDLVERNILHAGAPAIQQKQHGPPPPRPLLYPKSNPTTNKQTLKKQWPPMRSRSTSLSGRARRRWFRASPPPPWFRTQPPTNTSMRPIENILPENNVAPALLAAQKELEKSMLEDVLKEKLLHRPAPEAVIEKGILSGKTTAAPSGPPKC